MLWVTWPLPSYKGEQLPPTISVHHIHPGIVSCTVDGEQNGDGCSPSNGGGHGDGQFTSTAVPRGQGTAKHIQLPTPVSELVIKFKGLSWTADEINVIHINHLQHQTGTNPQYRLGSTVSCIVAPPHTG